MTESDLTEFVRADLESLGYTTYAEVLDTGSKIRCDMYARCEDETNSNCGHTIVFEAKLSFTLKVIEQAYQWKQRKRAHFVYLIVPSTYKNMKTRKFARELCKMLGIGVMEVNINSDKYVISVKPDKCINPVPPKLYEEQKLTIASNSDNTYVTPFKMTVKCLYEYMEHRDEEIMGVLMKNINHHYKTDMSGINAIKFLIEKQVIKGFYITKIKNKLVLKKHGF